MSTDWGHITLMGNNDQQTAETYWRHKVSGLRQSIEAEDVASALTMRIACYKDDEWKARRLIEAALDGVDQATIAKFIYLLMWRIQSEDV